MKYIIPFIAALLVAVSAHAERMNIIMETPAALEINDSYCAANPDVCYALYELDTEFVKRIMPGSEEVAGRKLILCSININTEDPLATIEQLIIATGVDWAVRHMQSFYNTIDPVIDQETGEIITPAMPTVYKQMDATVLDYVEPRPIKDAEDNIIGWQTKDYSWISQWQGAAEWKGL